MLDSKRESLESSSNPISGKSSNFYNFRKVRIRYIESAIVNFKLSTSKLNRRSRTWEN